MDEAGEGGASGRPEVVAMAPTGDGPGDNAYLKLLVGALRAGGVRVVEVQWRRIDPAVTVLHHHWPAGVGRPAGPVVTALRLARVLLVTAAHRARRVAVVWTGHNVVSHDAAHPRIERLFFAVYLRLVHGWIALSEASVADVVAVHPALRRRPHAVVPMGSFLGQYGPRVDRDEARRELGLDGAEVVVGYVGAIRPYKGVPALVDRFAELADPGTALLVAGKVADDAVADAVERARRAGADVRLRPERVPDTAMAVHLSAPDLLVFPFTSILNSSSVVLALSYGSIVVAPWSSSLGELQQQVGSEALHLYRGPLRPETLAALVARVRAGDLPASAEPRLPPWEELAERTVALYRRAAPRRR